MKEAKDMKTHEKSLLGAKKEKGAAPEALPSFLPFYFRVRAFSIQQTQLSRSLKQATRFQAQ